MRKLLAPLLALGLIATPAAAIDIFNLKNSLIQFALEQISTDDFTITAEDTESPGDGETDLVGVAIADREGVWFRAERIGLEWSASRILRGELEINRLFAEGVEVLRRPQGSVEVEEDAAIAQTDDEPFDWPRSPIATRVEEMRLTDVFIAEGVIAEPSIRFDAVGSARDEGDIQAVRLDLQRIDEVLGIIALDYERDFAADTLTVDLTAREDPGGLVAALAGLPERSASRVDVKADGPLTAWNLDFSAVAEEVIRAAGEARVDLEGRIAVTAGLRVTPGSDLDPQIASVLGEEARLDIDVAEDESGVVRIRAGRLESPALSLTANGSFARPTSAVDLDVVLEGRSGLADLAEGVAFEGFGFRGRVFGTPADLSAEGEVTLAELATEPADVGSAALGTEVRVQGERIDFDVSGRAERLRLDRLGPDLVGPADLSAAGVFDAGELTLSGVSLESALLEARADGRVGIEGNRIDIAYGLDAPRLGPIARAYGAEAAGSFAVDGTVSGALDAPRIAGTAELGDLRFEEEAWGAVRLVHDITAGPAIEGTAEIRAAGSPVGEARVDAAFRLADERLDLSRFAAEALGATFEGAVVYRLDTGLAEGAVDLDAPDLSPLARLAGAPASGSVAGRVELLPVEGRQDARLDLTARGVDAFEARLGRLSLEGRLRDALGTPALDAAVSVTEAGFREARVAGIEGRVAGTDLAAAADLDLDLAVTGAEGFGAALDRLTIEGRIADAAALAGVEATVTAEGVSAGGVRLARAEAEITAADALSDAPEAELIARLAGVSGAAEMGRADLRATLSPGETGVSARLRLDAPRVAAGGATVETVALRAEATDALGGDPRLSVRATTGAVTAEGARLDGVEATLEGLLSALDIAISTTGEAGDREVALETAARADLAAAVPVVRVTRLDAAWGEERASLSAPLTVTAGETIALEGLDLALPDDGRIAGDVALHPAGASGDVAIDLPSLALLHRIAAVPVRAGAVALSARFDTRAGRASAAGEIRGRGLVLDQMPEGVEPLTLDATLDWDGRIARLDAEIGGPFGAPARARAGIGLRPSGGPAPAVPAGAPLSGAVQWQGDVGEIWALVPGADHVLDGALDIDLSIDGTVNAPRIGGSVALDEGRYENLETGTILTDLTVSSEIEGADALALTAEARDGADGTVTAQVTLTGDRLEAALRTQDAVLVRRDDVKAAVGIDIRAEGPLTGPDISGTVEITRAEVRLVNATPPSVVTLGDVRIKGEPAPEETEPAGGTIALDIRIFADRGIFVRGRGLDSEWKADISVDGTAARPRVTGGIERIRGGLNFIGTNFDLGTGSVTFSGGREIDPAIDVRLVAEENGITGGIAVSGRASAPEIGFFSQPALPEDEVLPRILYGESSQSLSGGQALQLASGLATLLDGTGGVVDQARATVGLDVLTIDPTGDSASVTVGKNISEDVFVGVRQSFEGDTAVTVEVEVFPSVTVDAETGAEDGSSVGVNWSKDF